MTAKAYQITAGILMIFAVISPLRDFRGSIGYDLPTMFYSEGADIAASAQSDAQLAISDIIISKVQSYIMDEAQSLNADIEIVSIALDPETCIPISIQLAGTVSPYDQCMLSDYIQTTLGIDKEAQIWS